MRVDFHTHFIPQQLPDLGKKYGGDDWPLLLHRGSCQADIYYEGKPYRHIDDRSWDPQRRMRDMDTEGIDVQVISPIPVTFAYKFSAQAALELAQYQNDEIARVVAQQPDRFIGLGTVPLQQPHLAASELRRAVQRLGLAGVEIGTTIEGRNLDDPDLETFWSACEETAAALFVHPFAVLAPERFARYRMLLSTGYTVETGIAAASIVLSGLLDRHPALRFCFAHGGGIFPWLLPRLDQTWQTFDDVKETLKRRPSEVARLLMYDTLTYDAGSLRFLLRQFGSDRLMLGTDYPFPLREEPPGAVIDALQELSEDERALLTGRNALQFLRRA